MTKKRRTKTGVTYNHTAQQMTRGIEKRARQKWVENDVGATAQLLAEMKRQARNSELARLGPSLDGSSHSARFPESGALDSVPAPDPNDPASNNPSPQPN